MEIFKNSSTFFLEDQDQFFWQSIKFSAGFKNLLVTDSNVSHYPLGGFPRQILIGDQNAITSNQTNVFFDNLKEEQAKNKFLAGYLGYDLKNQLEDLESDNPDLLGFPDGQFFIPEVVLVFKGNQLVISSDLNCQTIFNSIKNMPASGGKKDLPSADFKGNFTKKEYLEIVHQIREHIQKGDIYELNLSQNFTAEEINFPYLEFYSFLSKTNPVPFSSLLKIDDLVMIGSSPERFLKKIGSKIWSQPMKGTRPRGKTPEEDERLKGELQNSEKEIAENMMIMDLVRNDLAKSCIAGSVKVEEMFKVYPFNTVFQMITTVSGILENPMDPINAIRNAFPMGSMTGAPKKKAMELIEKYETRKRGLYSGAFGFIEPSGDFEFSVNIRSLIYNSTKSILSYHVGGAITWDSIPENEYEECLWKAEHLSRLFKKN